MEKRGDMYPPIVFVVAGGKLIFYLLAGTWTSTMKLDMHQYEEQSVRKLLASKPAMSYVH
jgi:hypothetical protein